MAQDTIFQSASTTKNIFTEEVEPALPAPESWTSQILAASRTHFNLILKASDSSLRFLALYLYNTSQDCKVLDGIIGVERQESFKTRHGWHNPEQISSPGSTTFAGPGSKLSKLSVCGGEPQSSTRDFGSITFHPDFGSPTFMKGRLRWLELHGWALVDGNLKIASGFCGVNESSISNWPVASKNSHSCETLW